MKQEKSAISVDVEEYYHATNLEPYIGRRRWNSMPSRLRSSLDTTLALFSKLNTKATFFVLGSVAEKNKEAVKAIQEAGHEVASHGYDHRLAYNQSPEEFLEDVRKSKQILEDITGKEVRGYRAPNFSIIETNQWAFDQLLEAGYTYDSSVYPIWHPRYANTNKSRVPIVIKREAGSLIEVPLSTCAVKLFGKEVRLPVAGGAYWRLFPRKLISAGLRHVSKNEQMHGCCYFHPWELDSEQPRFNNMNFLTKIRHYGGIKSFHEKIESYLNSFSFVPIWQLLQNDYRDSLNEVNSKASSNSVSHENRD